MRSEEPRAQHHVNKSGHESRLVTILGPMTIYTVFILIVTTGGLYDQFKDAVVVQSMTEYISMDKLPLKNNYACTVYYLGVFPSLSFHPAY